MKTRNITREEAHDIGREVFVHMADTEKGGDRDYLGVIRGYKNTSHKGVQDFQVWVEVKGRCFWQSMCRVFVEDDKKGIS
jgi:hypothetical protein